jgi:hypothetical protein
MGANEEVRAFISDPVLQQRLAKYLVFQCFRNSMLEDFHAGTSPASASGDYADVSVSGPYGVIPWPEVSRLNDDEMKARRFNCRRTVLQDELRSERNSGACSQIQVVQGHDGEGHIRMLLSFLMRTDHIVALLIAERDKLNAPIEALQGTSKDAPPKNQPLLKRA